MLSRFTALVLEWLRVPAEPHAPHGDPASLRVFRAGRNLFTLKLVGWGVTQAIAFVGIIFWVTVFIEAETEMNARRKANPTVVAPTQVKDFEEYLEKIDAAAPGEEVKPATSEVTDAEPAAPQKAVKKQRRARINGWAGFKHIMVQFALLLPPWAFPVLWALKIAGILAYLFQLPLTYLIVRMDYELRWYMVTDRSLRIRFGVWKVVESTMSFANIQQVVVSQGPVQRLLGLADVKVQSAGGGSGKEHHKGGEDDMHMGLFHSVTNAPEIRDLIQLRLRRFRESGLGDPEEKSTVPSPGQPVAPGTSSPALLDAARELAAEARALRASLS